MRKRCGASPVWAAAAFVLLAGCSGADSRSTVPALKTTADLQIVPVSSSAGTPGRLLGTASLSFARPVFTGAQAMPFNNAAGQRTAYIADCYGNFIDAFAMDGTLTARITNGLSGPGGMAVDSSGNLWVANGGANSVAVFPPGSTAPSRILNDTAGSPGDVTVTADGTAYVSNTAGNNGPNIAVFPPGHTTPTRYLGDPESFQNGFITSDAAGNVFFDFTAANLMGHVDEFVNGKQTGFKRLPIGNSAPGGIKMYNGYLLISNQITNTVREYTTAGIATGNVLYTGGDWVDFAPSKNGLVLLAADSTHIEGATRYFPSGVFQRYFADSAFQFPCGAAFDPAI